MTVELLTLTALSVVIVWVSRASLCHYRSHGFCRFLAWEVMAALLALNMRHWFEEPFSPHQLASWGLLIVSLYMVAHGFVLLRKLGKRDRSREEPSLISVEKTAELVTAGVYGYIRHPLYSSLLFLTWGIFFKVPSWFGLGLALLASGFLTATAKVEEGENVRYFGPAYEKYMQTTKMFIPFIF